MRKTIYLAQPVGSASVPELRLVASQTIPEVSTLGEAGLAAAKEFYAEQGKAVVEALYASLPGGTLDAVLCEMLQRKASLFRVPFDAPAVAPV